MLVEQLITELRASLGEFTTRELVIWKGHVLMHPYRGGSEKEGISKAVIDMLDEELGKRKEKRERMRKDFGIDEDEVATNFPPPSSYDPLNLGGS